MNTKGRNTERGASLMEYALLVALIAALAVPSLTLFGSKASTTFSTVERAMACQGGEDICFEQDEDD